jgi:type IX secretion system PorP/SprF family membrane protein
MIPWSKGMAQADIYMATHWYNHANYNPASIARTDYIYLFSNFRQQWLGVNGAPQVFNFQASEYINSLRSALGVSIVSDRIGAAKSLNPMITYAYRIAKQQDWSLAFGISAGAFSTTVNGSLFDADNPTDPNLYLNLEKSVKPDFNAGIEFQNSKFAFGFSSTHLLSVFKTENLYLNTNHRYTYAVYKNTSPNFFNYNIGFQLVNRYNLTFMEINTTFRIKQKSGLVDGLKEVFDVGITYRTTQQLTILLCMNVLRNARIGYAYDYSYAMGFNRNGTHEIMIEYRIPSKASSTSLKCGDDLFGNY